MPRLTEMRADETYSGANFTAEEIEFLLAIERYQRERHRPFPTWHEVLRVLKSLGYRKVAPPRSPRKYQSQLESRGKDKRKLKLAATEPRFDYRF